MEIKEIRTLIDLMKKNGLAVFKMEEGDFKITLKTPEGAIGTTTMVQGSPQHISPAPAAIPASAAAPVAPAESAPADYQEILSPIVGTFYSASSPDAPPFVTVGQKVQADSVVCIIEAMKVMNEIKAEISGTVIEVLVENGKPVQFGQTLFRVR